jgi:hypothetical protein
MDATRNQLVHLEATAPPSLLEGFQGDIEADCVPEPETVRDRPGEAVDAHGMAFESMRLDAQLQHRRPNGPKRREAEAGHARAARNRNLYLMGQLRSDVMDAQGREKTDDRRRHSGSGKNHRSVLRAGNRTLCFPFSRIEARSAVRWGVN